MKTGKTSISKARTYAEIGEFWDTHDASDYWDLGHPVEFEVDVQSTVTYFPVEKELTNKLRSMAKQKGVSAQTLLNLWIQEKLSGDAKAA